MKFKRASIFTKIVILALIVYATVLLTDTRSQIREAEAHQAQLQTRVDALLQENAALRYDLDHAGDEEIIAEIARGKLGLVLPGEKIFYDIST